MTQDYDTASYPRWRYHRTREPRIVNSVEEDKALGEDWANTPAAFYERIGPEPELKRTRKVTHG